LYVGGLVVATDIAWPQPLKYPNFSNRNVRVETSSSRDEITVWAGISVKGLVFEERECLKLSDNGFDLVRGRKRSLWVERAQQPRSSHGHMLVQSHVISEEILNYDQYSRFVYIG
jgi:beta-mannosidase